MAEYSYRDEAGDVRRIRNASFLRWTDSLESREPYAVFSLRTGFRYVNINNLTLATLRRLPPIPKSRRRE